MPFHRVFAAAAEADGVEDEWVGSGGVVVGRLVESVAVAAAAAGGIARAAVVGVFVAVVNGPYRSDIQGKVCGNPDTWVAREKCSYHAMRLSGEKSVCLYPWPREQLGSTDLLAAGGINGGTTDYYFKIVLLSI